MASEEKYYAELFPDTSDFYFDLDAAMRAVEFMQSLPHIKGPLRNQKFILQPWQKHEIIMPLFGYKRREDGTRRYRSAYIEMGRKNGKSFMSAAIALYLLFADNEGGAEVYSAAKTRDQALFVFEPACKMVTAVPWLRKHSKIYESSKRIEFPATDSYYRALSRDAGTAHGGNPHGVIFDELHVQPDRKLWEALETGQGARSQPLTIAITTAGHDRQSLCWDEHVKAERILDPNDDYDDLTHLAVIYGAKPTDDWNDREVWKRANPNYGVSISPQFLEEQYQKAKANVAQENSFRRLFLSQWTEQQVRWLPMEDWDRCAKEPDPTPGRDAYAGLDIASTRDLASLVLVIPTDIVVEDEDEDSEPVTKLVYDLFPYFWTPSEVTSKAQRRDRLGFENWVLQGKIFTCDGPSIEQADIRNTLWDLAEQFNIHMVGFDPWNMDACAQALIQEGWPVGNLCKMPQSFATYNEPMKQTLELLKAGQIRHGGHPVLRWNASNVVVREDPAGNVRPDKGKSPEKIDGWCAFQMGLALALDSYVAYDFYENNDLESG